MTILLYLGLGRWRLVSVAKLEGALYSEPLCTAEVHNLLRKTAKITVMLVVAVNSE